MLCVRGVVSGELLVLLLQQVTAEEQQQKVGNQLPKAPKNFSVQGSAEVTRLGSRNWPKGR